MTNYRPVRYVRYIIWQNYLKQQFKRKIGKIQQIPLNSYDKETTQVNIVYLYQEPVDCTRGKIISLNCNTRN